MGMYTGLVLDLETKPETPDDVIEILKFLIDRGDDNSLPPCDLPDHALFQETEARWTWVLRGANGYPVIGERAPELYRPEWYSYSWYSKEQKGNAYVLSVKSSIKNYQRQFELFLDWIEPWVYDARGWIMYEEDEVPTVICKNLDEHDQIQFVGPFKARS